MDHVKTALKAYTKKWPKEHNKTPNIRILVESVTFFYFLCLCVGIGEQKIISIHVFENIYWVPVVNI